MHPRADFARRLAKTGDIGELVAVLVQGMVYEACEYVFLRFELEGKMLMDVFFLIPNLNADVVIGVDTMQKYHMKLDFETGEIKMPASAGRLLLM